MKWASAIEHKRYAEKIRSASRRRCDCGCKTRSTHIGCANGMALMNGCELSVRRWVKYGPKMKRIKENKP